VNYEEKVYTFNNGVSVFYLVDQKNNWTEGVNSNGISIVSAALENHFDSIQGEPPKEYKKFIKEVNKRNGIILRRALRQPTLEEAKDLLLETYFIGNTLLTDGKKLWSLEIGIDPKSFNSEVEIEDNQDLDFHEFKMEMMKNLDPKDFKVSAKEIDKDLYVKTNHSVEVKNLGYNDSDRGYESSTKRRQYVMDALKDFDGGVVEVMELLNTLGGIDIDKNPEMRPKRVKDKVGYSDKEKEEMKISNYFTTDILGFKKGTMYILPLHSRIKNPNIEKVLKKTGINFVILKGQNESLLRRAYLFFKIKG
jgi:hypothetical protein